MSPPVRTSQPVRTREVTESRLHVQTVVDTSPELSAQATTRAGNFARDISKTRVSCGQLACCQLSAEVLPAPDAEPVSKTLKLGPLIIITPGPEAPRDCAFKGCDLFDPVNRLHDGLAVAWVRTTVFQPA